MATKPDFDTGAESKKKAEGNKPLLFGIIFAVFIVVMIAGMLFLDIYAENKEKEQSHATQPSDAAER